MAGFLYIIEGERKAVSLAEIAELGLGYAFDGSPTCCESQSPSGVRGLCIADSSRLGDRVPGYYPQEQTWRELPAVAGRPRIWVGLWNAEKPTATSLQRGKMVNGLVVHLADGDRWQVPEVRCHDGQQWECRLPCYLDYDSDGKLKRGEPLLDYRALWESTSSIASALFAAETDGSRAEVTDQEMVDCAVSLLQANYAVSFPELVLLNTLSDGGDTALIVMAACRKDRLLGWVDLLQKKSESPATLIG